MNLATGVFLELFKRCRASRWRAAMYNSINKHYSVVVAVVALVQSINKIYLSTQIKAQH